MRDWQKFLWVLLAIACVLWLVAFIKYGQLDMSDVARQQTFLLLTQ